jgi:outer membrane receptor protein involved in Fe transport
MQMLRFSCLTLTLFVILCSFYTTFGGDYGKIIGRVTDKGTQEPLLGANVVVLNTTLGAMTDTDGRYVILNVPPGTYSMRISYMGYTTIEMHDVNVVQDLVTEINAELPEKVIELTEVIRVFAERPLIHKEVSGSVTNITSDEFRNRPIESIQSVINTSAGVVTYQGQTFIRGSRSTDIVYIVDGVPLTNPITGTLMSNISKNAVEEIVLMTGGFSAEYGNAMGGVVNVSTKEGGSFLSGSLRYKSDKLSSASQYYQNLNIWDLTLGGPVYENIRFFLTGYLNLRDMSPQREVIAPDGTNLGRHPHQGFQEYRTNAKFTLPIGTALKLRLSGSINRSQQLLYDMLRRFGSAPELLDRGGALWEKTSYASLALDHALSNRTMYTLKIGFLEWQSKNGQLDRNQWSGDAIGIQSSWLEDFKFRSPFLDHNYQIPGDPTIYSKWRLKDSWGIDDVYSQRTADSVSVNNPYGIPGGILNSLDAGYFQNFIWSGDRDYYEQNRNRQYSVRFDLTTLPTSNQELKGGFEAVWHRVNRFRIGAMGALNGVGVTYPIIDFYEKSPTDTALTVEDGGVFSGGYTPIELSAYAIYQLQLEGIYFNLGLRYDYYNAETEYRIDPLQPTESNPFKQTRASSKSRSQFSPRLGISFPVTDRMVLRFNYGHFFQRPPMDRMFSYLWFDRNQADVNQGNPNLEPQKTIAYEVGISAVITDDIALEVTAFQKNISHLEGFRLFRAPDLQWLSVAMNREYGESYGIEFSLRKRYSNWTSAMLNYTYSVARGTASDVTQITRYPLTSTTYAKELGYEPLYPQETMPMNFDRPHTANLIFDLSIPDNDGPVIFGVKPFSGFGFNLTGTIQSGTPYSPMTSYFVNLTTDLFNSARYPTTYNLDCRISKRFKWSALELSIFAEIFNVLNLETPFAVFHGSGNADEPSYRVTRGVVSSESYPSTHPLYSTWADTNTDGILDPEERYQAYKRLEADMLALKPNYNLPRRIFFGAEIQFNIN